MDRKDAKNELKKIVEQYRTKPYSFWKDLLNNNKQITFEITSQKGKRYQVEIQAVSEGGGNIRAWFDIDDGGIRAIFPMHADFIISKEDKFIGESIG